MQKKIAVRQMFSLLPIHHLVLLKKKDLRCISPFAVMSVLIFNQVLFFFFSWLLAMVLRAPGYDKKQTSVKCYAYNLMRPRCLEEKRILQEGEPKFFISIYLTPF